MKNLSQRLSEWWFTPLAPQRLALLRIATGVFSLWYLLMRIHIFSNLSESGAAMFDPIGAVWWLRQPLPDVWIQLFLAITIALNVAYAAGWKFRFTGPAFALSLLLLFSYRNSWSMIYHDMNALVLQVLAIGFAASAGAYSADARHSERAPLAHWSYGWPIKLICTVTTFTYFVSGIAKINSDYGWAWAGGESLRSQVAIDTLRKEVLGGGLATPLFEWMYEHTWMFMIMGVVTLILELGAPLAMVHRRVGMVWAVLTWLMHWGIFFVMGITFRYQMLGFIFLPFFDIEQVLPWLRKRFKNKALPVKATETKASEPAIVLFDGVCNFCHAGVQFILRRDHKGVFQFASQQSESGQQLLRQHNAPLDLSTLVLIENGQVYQQSTAILRIVRRLVWPWAVFAVFILAPRPLRDAAYRAVADNRYRWWGRKASCELPAPEWRGRFLV